VSSSQGATFDTGMLIALERRRQRAWAVYRRLIERKVSVTIPTPVVGEWWRGRTDLRDAICRSARVEPLTDSVARLAGEALAAVPGAGTIDAFVMSTASLRGDIVFTSDVGDLEKLRRFFPGVRVLGV
jgi:predicted nucleic acid-binding protein